MTLNVSRSLSFSEDRKVALEVYNTDVGLLFDVWEGIEDQSLSLGALTITPSVNATDIFKITNAAGTALITMDTTNAIFKVNAISKLGDGGTTNYAQFAADGELTLAGTARVTREIVVGAGLFHKGSSAPDDVILSNGLHVLAFDKTTVQHAHYNTIIPPDFASGTTLSIQIDWAFDTAEANHYQTWVVEYLLVADGEDPSGAITRTFQKSVISTGNNDKQLHMTFGTGITGAVADETLLLTIYRDSDATYDTDDLNQDSWLFAFHLHYIADKLGTPT